MSRNDTFMLFEHHHKYHLPIAVPHSDMRTWNERMDLILEEYKDLFAEWNKIKERLVSDEPPGDELMASFLKEMCDCEYALRGTGIAFGLPYPHAFDAVHEANMTKTGRQNNGRKLNGKGYKAPDILALFK